MDTSFFRLINFLNEKDFLKLQRCFLSNDFYNSFESKIFKVNNIPKIMVQDNFFIDDDVEQKVSNDVEVEFWEDFLMPGIKEINKNELNDFKKSVLDKALFTKQSKEGYALEVKNKLENYEQKIPDLKYLPSEVIGELLNQIRLCNKEIKSFIKNPYLKFEKIEIDCNRIDIELFFHLLIKNKKISSKTVTNIGNMIDNSFKFKHLGAYESILDSNKSFSKIDNALGIEQSTERLKALFSNPDFYAV